MRIKLISCRRKSIFHFSVLLVFGTTDSKIAKEDKSNIPYINRIRCNSFNSCVLLLKVDSRLKIKG